MKLHLPNISRDFSFSWLGFIMSQAVGIGSGILGFSFFMGNVEDWSGVVGIIFNIIFGLIFIGIFLLVEYISFFYEPKDLNLEDNTNDKTH